MRYSVDVVLFFLGWGLFSPLLFIYIFSESFHIKKRGENYYQSVFVVAKKKTNPGRDAQQHPYIYKTPCFPFFSSLSCQRVVPFLAIDDGLLRFFSPPLTDAYRRLIRLQIFFKMSIKVDCI